MIMGPRGWILVAIVAVIVAVVAGFIYQSIWVSLVVGPLTFVAIVFLLLLWGYADWMSRGSH